MRPAEILVLILTIIATVLLIRGAGAEEPPPPITARDLTLNDARAYALATVPEPVKCFQVRERGITAMCITKLEWTRQHEHERVTDAEAETLDR